MPEVRARDADKNPANDSACRFPFVLQTLQTRNDCEYEPEPEPVPSGQSQSQRRLIYHQCGSRSAIFLCHGLQKQTMENPSRSRTARATAVPRSAAVRQTRGGSHSASRLPGRGLPRLEVLPLESHCREPGGAQQLSRPRDRKADRARSRVAAAGIPPSKRATAVLTRAPEWGTLSDGGKTAGGGKREPPGVRRRVNLEARGAGANDAPTRSKTI